LVFVDTSAWYALFSRTDRGHAAVAKAFSQARKGQLTLVTSHDVLDETLTLARMRAGHSLALALGEAIWQRRGAELLGVDDATRDAAWSIFRKHADQDLSFTDCTSAALMRARGIEVALTLDRHFSVLGFSVLPAS
jgi:predicted nucleic acid-binding protein